MAKKNNDLTDHVSGQSNRPLSKPAHSLTWNAVIQELNTSALDGLATSEARSRFEGYGGNDLGDADGVNPVKILVRQVANAMNLVLLLAMAVSFGIKSWIEGGVTAAVIAINIGVGFYQEFQAEKTMDSLRSMSSPTSTVIRDGKTIKISTSEVVPGDMVEIKTGDSVPADIRLVEAVNLETDESMLTGESLPIHKNEEKTFDEKTGPGDRLNVAYSQSTVTKGRATGVVFATGMYTEIGSIAAALRKKDSRIRPVKRNAKGQAKPHRYAQAGVLTMTDAVGAFLGISVGTPLQRKLSQLACYLFIIAVIFAVVVLAANNFRSRQEVIIYAVATGLSMIPSSLVVVLTITMAAGTRRMVQRNVIVRNLRSLEALGCVTDICSDKTGTLTQGKMITKKAWIPSFGTLTIGETDEPFNPTKGVLTHSSKAPKDMLHDSCSGDEKEYAALVEESDALKEYLKVATLANLARVRQTENGSWNARGDPTEVAIKVFATRFQRMSGDPWKMLVEFPFDSTVKKMSVIYQDSSGDRMFSFTKGAVERVITSCIQYEANGEVHDMTEEYRAYILENMEALAVLGLRCLALASKEYTEPYEEGQEIPRDTIERDLTFRGLIGIYDPPRPESADSVLECHQAGIEVHMLTGDHPGTAKAIALEVGILPSKMSELSKDVTDAMVMTAAEFDEHSDDEIDRLPVLPLVIARCAPNTKVRMIEALHRRKRFCAMTGDGVNDSPSIKRADVGIAMGQAGSDVAKDASDIILTDDNFASIIAAIEEGRRTFDNIQKFVLHLLAQNVALAIVLLVGLAVKDSENISVFPVSPVEILWIIMITSGIPDMGLGFERAAPDIMQRPPQDLKRGVFTTEVLIDIAVYGIWVAALTLGSFVLRLYGFGHGNIGYRCNESIHDGCETAFRSRSTCFALVTWMSVFLAWELTDPRRSFFRMHETDRYFTQWMHDVWANKFLFYAVVGGFLTLFVILYIPGLDTVVFKHTGISWEWTIVFIATILFFIGVESWKWAKRGFYRRRAKARGDGREEDAQMRVFERYLSNSREVGGEKV
ncbi:potassium/sodium eff [Piedraia hortae CBS 480.64]|uniref:P-type Na(+) transporter n=1 Tax=Piedraia hortae CBS 480.64 TaxID=1314780 RepID=A0A6A7BT76_9PEZI|nr:potassium/sodium eff [Piedraia hortae CBS 480.64]